MPKSPKSFRLDSELCERLAAEAAKQERSEAWVVERALETALNEGAAADVPRSVVRPADVPAASSRAPKPVRLNVARSLLKEHGAYKPLQRPGS